MPDNLFNDFSPTSLSEWNEQVIKELKGKSPDRLNWQVEEGISISPYYDQSSGSKLQAHSDASPEWLTILDFSSSKVDQVKALAKTIGNDLDGFGFEVGGDGFKIEEAVAILKDGSFAGKQLHFRSGLSTADLVAALSELRQAGALDANSLAGFIDNDFLSSFTRTGNLPHSQEKMFELAAANFLQIRAIFPFLKALSASAEVVEAAGGNYSTQLASVLAIASEYLDSLGIDQQEVASALIFQVPINVGFFPEISKLRALRLLWNSLQVSYGLDPQVANIHCTTSKRRQSIFDSQTNLLRSTTSAMAAVIGGTDSLSIRPHDQRLADQNYFSSRIACNIQHLLRHESYLGIVADPAAGSYYIDALTNEIADEAWKKFLQIRKAGGYLKAYESGLIHQIIQRQLAEEDVQVATRKKVLVGINNYPPPISSANFVEPTGKEEDDGLVPQLEGAKFERLRIKIEKLEKRPQAVLILFGQPAMRKARSNFSANLFGCAGIETREVEYSEIESVLDSPDYLVLCAANEDYESKGEAMVSDLATRFPAARIFLAGSITNEEDAKTWGVEGFIQFGMNAIKFLDSLLTSSGKGGRNEA